MRDMSPWRNDPFVRWTRGALTIVIGLLVMLVASIAIGIFTLVGHYHQEAIRQEAGTRKGLTIVKELTDGNQAVLDQLKLLSDTNAAALEHSRLAGRCTQWFIITELRILVARAGGDPIPKSVIPVPDIRGLNCSDLLREDITPNDGP